MKEGRENSLESLSLSKTRRSDYIVGSQFNGFTHSPPDPGSPKGFFPQFPSELLQDSSRLLQLETESGVSEICSKLGTKRA